MRLFLTSDQTLPYIWDSQSVRWGQLQYEWFVLARVGGRVEQDSGTKTFLYREPYKTQTSSAHNLKKKKIKKKIKEM